MNYKIVVMGVSGCGKSSVASKIAERLSIPFVDGDDYHSEESIRKMSSGTPLTDEDRFSWLNRLNGIIKENDQLVLACSSLTPTYRDILRKGNPELRFVYLQGTLDVIWPRMSERSNHYFSGLDLLKSQFKTLIEPTEEEAIIIPIDQPVDDVVMQAVEQLSSIEMS
ncbi:gluconokinase [Reinekea blandensis]|uniref:Gluconokinase n=1 Tax=Reinekea blandensis MED297 TaxID=314283 RepID=A4BHG0_9GAMM|nr:gluconokinase [Reinekea blandensis]EAR08508.1 Gluconate kinase [Reinekea sp. MED297] [Reinekea blandensis MED297]